MVDQSSNLVPDGDAPVTNSIYSGPAHAKLIGKTKVRAVDGVATFSGPQAFQGGNYTLEGDQPGFDTGLLERVHRRTKAEGQQWPWQPSIDLFRAAGHTFAASKSNVPTGGHGV